MVLMLSLLVEVSLVRWLVCGLEKEKLSWFVMFFLNMFRYFGKVSIENSMCKLLICVGLSVVRFLVRKLVCFWLLFLI